MDIDLEKFYRIIHPNVGYRAFCTLKKYVGKDNKPATSVTPHWGGSFKELVKNFGYLLGKADIYHTCYGFNSTVDRIAKHAEFFKCMVLDIDRKNDKGEATEEDILAKLKPIAKYYGGHKLQINRSGGGGIHVYLPLSEICDKSTWLSASKSLLHVCEGIKGLDTKCTIDAARILRIPGTTHSKTNNTVEVVQWGECKFKPILINGYRLEADKTSNEFVDKRYEKVTLDTLIDTCGHIAKLAAGWEGQHYDSWLGCATILKRIPQGIEAFHEFSRQASNYDKGAAERVLTTTTGDSCQSCRSFASISMEANPCMGCPSLRHDKTALEACLLRVARNDPGLEPSQVPLPYGYRIDEEGRVLGTVSNGRNSQVEVEVANRAIYVDAIFRDDIANCEMVSFRFRKFDDNSWGNITVPKSKAYTVEASKAVNAMVSHKPNTWANFAYDLVTSYENTKKKVMPLANYFGWRTYGDDEQKEDVFVLGHDVYGEKGVIGHAYLDTSDDKIKELARYYTSVSKSVDHEEKLYQESFELFDLFMKDKSIHYGSKLQVAASLMSPLLYYAVKYCPEAGLGGIFINVYGETGRGKTLGVRMAASIWGSPGGEGIPGVLRSNISEAAVWIALDKARHLPLCMDEFLNNAIGKKAETADDFIKAISTGRSSERATSDGKARPVFSFNCPCLSSSNKSVKDFVGSGVSEEMAAAARARIIEYHTEGSAVHLIGKSPYDRCLSLYSVLGRRWLLYFMQPHVKEQFRNHLGKVNFNGYSTDGRFIVKFKHILEFVIEEARLAKAKIINFPEGFVEEFDRTQKEAIEEASMRRLLSPTQLTFLSYLNRYKHTALTYERIPNGKYPKESRIPTDIGAPGYQHNTCMYINVLDPPSVCIPQQNIKTWYQETAKDRSFISETRQLAREGSCSIAINVQILGLKDPTHLPDCFVFPRKILQSWQALASGIIWDYHDESEQE